MLQNISMDRIHDEHDQENDRDNLEYYHGKNYKENNEKGKKISYICTKSMK